MPRKLTPEERADRRERKREREHRRYEERKAFCLARHICFHCRQPILSRSPRKGWCADCRTKNVRSQRERAQAKLAAELAANATTACPRCGGTNAGHARNPRDGERFYCKDCRRRLRGTAELPEKGPFPCPYCAGRCGKVGATRGSQRFRCRQCGRCNTLLRRNPDIAAPPLPLRHTADFYLGPWHYRDLETYCENRGMPHLAQGIRDLLRRWAYPPGATTRVARDAFGERVVLPLPREKWPPLKYADTPLPNVAGKSLAARQALKREHGLLSLPRTANVQHHLRVQLDDEAWEGLHNLMHQTGKSHQEVLRWLIGQQHPVPN